jgi:ATP-dependent metalloprotease
MSKIKYETSIEPGYLARQTAGFSGNLVQQKLGADIQNMVNVAILNAIKNNRKIAESSDFEFSLDRISMGKCYAKFLRNWQKEYVCDRKR